jgi:hypothetical protein
MKGGGTPKIKAGKSYVGGGQTGVTNISSGERELIKITGPGRAEIKLPQASARPAHAALALAKMAWLMSPPDVRARHGGLHRLIRGKLKLSDQPTPLFDVWMACRIPTTVAVWERVADGEIAKLVVMLAFGHVALFWAAPDEATGLNRDFLIPPLPRGADHERELVAHRFMATGDQRTRANPRTITVAFEEQRRAHAATSQAARIRVRHDERETELSTFAISPAGATSERPHFILSGGDLVGRMEVEDTDGNDAWSWSYEPLPTEGDVDRTVAALVATMRGGTLEISSPVDGAIFCEGRFPPSSPAETTRLCRIAQMAYYVGVLNRKLATDVQLASFSFDELMEARWLALGVTHGSYTERTRDGRHTINADAPIIAKLREWFGSNAMTLSLRDDISYEVLGTRIEVGPTRLVLIDAKVEGDWDAIVATAQRDGSAAVTFLCAEVGHVFERYTKGES